MAASVAGFGGACRVTIVWGGEGRLEPVLTDAAMSGNVCLAFSFANYPFTVFKGFRPYMKMLAQTRETLKWVG